MMKKYTMQIDNLNHDQLKELFDKLKITFSEDTNVDIEAYDTDDHMIIIMTLKEAADEKSNPLTVVPDVTH